jgi:hypothetical protein
LSSKTTVPSGHGGGDKGNLGLGNTNASFLPTQVGTDTDWAFVEADSKSSFAIKTNGTLWAWGENWNGRLGNGTSTDLLVPTQIGTATDWASVSTSYSATLALKTDGSLFAWGSNNFMQYGNGTSTSQSTPLLITTCSLGTDDFDKSKDLILYPNPASDRVNIRFETLQGESQVEIYDLTGRLISSFTNQENQGVIALDLAPMATGVYVVVLRQGGAVLMQRKLQVL